MVSNGKLMAFINALGGGSSPSSPAPTEVVILPETEAQDVGGMLGILTPLAAPMVAGAMYKVTYNGVVYECPALDASAMMPGALILGNAEKAGMLGGNADAPFMLAIVHSGMPGPTGEMMYGSVSPLDDATSVTLSIVGEAGEETPIASGDFILRVVETDDGVVSTQKWSEVVSAVATGKRVRMIITISPLDYESYLFLSVRNEGVLMGLYFFTAGFMTNELIRYTVEPGDDDSIKVRLV